MAETNEKALLSHAGRPSTSKAAVWSLVIGILIVPLGPIAPIAAILLATIALTRIRRSAGQVRGKGLAIAGLVVGLIGIPVSVFILVLVLIIPGPLPTNVMCANNLKQIGLALTMYESEHDGIYPPSLSKLYENNEYITLDPYIFVCPSSEEDPPEFTDAADIPDVALWGSYVYVPPSPNDRLSTTPVCWDKQPWHVINTPSEHGVQGRNVLYADGHVSFLRGTDPPEATKTSLSGQSEAVADPAP